MLNEKIGELTPITGFGAGGDELGMGGAASCLNLGISVMSLRMGAVDGRVSVALASGAATVFEVGEVDQTSEEVSVSLLGAANADCINGIVGSQVNKNELIPAERNNNR